MNGIFNSIFWFISPLPAAFLYNYTLAYLLALKRKKMFSLVISLISFAFSTFCFLCPGLPYRQFLNPISSDGFWPGRPSSSCPPCRNRWSFIFAFSYGERATRWIT